MTMENTTAMAPWTQGIVYGFDTETTDADPMAAHVLTASLVKYENGVKVDVKNWTLKAAVPSKPEAVEVHGLTDEWIAENGTDAAAGIEEIGNILTKILQSTFPLVIFNAPFDLTVMERQLMFYGLTTMGARVNPKSWTNVVDPYTLTKGLEHYVLKEFVKGRKFTLSDVAERYGVSLGENAHAAEADASAAIEVALKVVNMDESLWGKSPVELLELQRKWRFRQQKNMERFLNSVLEEGEERKTVDVGFPAYDTAYLPL